MRACARRRAGVGRCRVQAPRQGEHGRSGHRARADAMRAVRDDQPATGQQRASRPAQRGEAVMAVAPRAFCLVTRCRARSVPGSRKCETHRSAPVAKVAEPVYHSREWHAARARALRDNPWCAWCHATTGLSVDHIVPLSAGGTHESANLRVLCLSCHGRRSAEQAHGRRGWVRPDGTREGSTEAAVARPYVQNLQRHGEGRGQGRSLPGWPNTPAPTTA